MGQDQTHQTVQKTPKGNLSKDREKQRTLRSSKLDEIRDIKVQLIGDGGVGKTSILIRYCEKKWKSDGELPTIFDNKVAKVRYNDQMLGINLWDSASEEDYDELFRNAFENTDVFIFFFDVSRRNSFLSLKEKWIRRVLMFTDHASSFILCGMKSDLRSDPKISNDRNDVFVEEQEAENYAKEIFAYSYIETSAKESVNVDELFLSCLNSRFKNEETNDHKFRDSSKKGTRNCYVM